MNVLSLFSGIGGLDLGLERAGMRIVGHVEIDPYCQRVLTKHWPEVPQHDDVRTAPKWWTAQSRLPVDLVAGGFPCQPHSLAGNTTGTEDERWGWPWFRDVIDAVNPPLVLIENVPHLTRTGLVHILRDLAERGFDAWWIRVPAASFGAPHLRWRLVVIAAHPARIRFTWQGDSAGRSTVPGYDGRAWSVANSDRATWPPPESPDQGTCPTAQGSGNTRPGGRSVGLDERAWTDQLEVARVANGIPDRLDRNRTLGNAVVPAVGEYVGLLVMAGIAAAVRRAA